MSVTQGQFERIQRNRRVYLNSGDGRQALRELLESCLIFGSRKDWMLLDEDPKWSLTKIVQGLCLLESLGVLVEDNYDRLIEAMAGLPMPQIQGEANGETL